MDHKLFVWVLEINRVLHVTKVPVNCLTTDTFAVRASIMCTRHCGEILVAKQECGNPEDVFAVAVKQRSSSSEEVVSRLPREFSHVL